MSLAVRRHGEEEEQVPLVRHKASPGCDCKQALKIAGCASLGILTVGLVAFAALKDLGMAWNAVNTLAAGLALQATLECIPYRHDPETKTITIFGKTVNIEKDKLVKYSATFFICATNIYLNLPQPRWLTRVTYGTFNILLGMLIATKIDTVLHWTLKDSRIPEPTADASMKDLSKAGGALLYSDTIKVFPLDKKKPGAEAREDQMRIIAEVVKLLFAASVIGGLLLTKYYAPKSLIAGGASVPLKFAYILLGHAMGCIFHETVHGIHKRVQKKYPIQEDDSLFGAAQYHTPLPIKIMIAIEKVERMMAVIFTGIIIAFNRPMTDVVSGALMGTLVQIDLIEFTQTHMSKHKRLERMPPHEKTWMRTAANVAKWGFAVLIVGGFLAIGIVQGIFQGPAANAWALGTVAVVVYPSYLFTKKLDKKEINQNSSPFVNNLFFFTNYSLAAPILYIAVSQVLKIGDTALDTYNGYATAVACIGWASLAWAFGTQAGQRATDRKVTFPAEVDPLIILFTFFFVQQLLGLA